MRLTWQMHKLTHHINICNVGTSVRQINQPANQPLIYSFVHQRTLITFTQLNITAIGFSKALYPSILVSLRRSRIYIDWGKNILCFDLATSMPRKYFKLPKSFISNSFAREFLSFISHRHFVTRITSTYTTRVISFPREECSIKIV